MKTSKITVRNLFNLRVLFGTILITCLAIILAFTINKINKNKTPLTISIPSPHLWKSEVIYYKTVATKRSGIWKYDLLSKKETQLLSFFDTISLRENQTLDLYSRPILSPDKTKVAFYVGIRSKNYDPNESNDEYSLWVFDLVTQEKKKLLNSVRLYGGYTQEPVWSLDSKMLYVTFYNEGKNSLFAVDLEGRSKNLITNWVFWPRVVSNEIVVHNTYLPETKEIGIFNYKTNKHYVVNTKSSTYLIEVKKIKGDYLIKANFPNLVYSYGGVQELIDRETVYGLEKINLNSKQVEAFKIPSSFKLDSAIKRIQFIGFCNDEWVTLGAVKNNPQGQEEYARYYIFSLITGYLKVINSSDISIRPRTCKILSPTVLSYTDSGLRTINIDINTGNELESKNFNEVIPKDYETQCLNKDIEYHVGGIGKGVSYLRLWPGFDECYIFNNKQGLYRLDLNNKTFMRIATDSSVDEDDWVLVAEE